MIDIIATAAAYWAKMELGKAAGAAVMEQLATAGVKQAYSKLTRAAAAGSPYRNELHRVVDQLLDEYRQQHPDALTGSKHYFWATTWAMNWALTYKFYAPNSRLQLADIPDNWEKYIHRPTQEQLDKFSARVHTLLSSNKDLQQLYESANQVGEAFRANARAEEQRGDINEHLVNLTQAVRELGGPSDTAAEQAERVRLAFEAVSWSLASADNTIPNLDVRLDRRETARVLSWLTSPLQEEEQPLAVVEGGAGMGKTAIMRDVLEGLRAMHLPVLALKADRQYNATYFGLVQLLLTGTGLTDISQALDLLRTDHAHRVVVVLIDQLDALSQSLSTNRELLHSYRELIQALLAMENVRVVVSCRTFDLDTDPLLQTYSKKSRFTVEVLRDEQVVQVVAVSALAGQQLGPALRELLRVPLHLRIFCELRGGTNISGITTLQALYDELYQQRILDPIASEDAPAPDSAKLQLLLAELAVSMYETQRLTVPARRYERQQPNEVRYALSQNLLVHAREGGHLQCFHQTFSDYLFARQFVEKGQQLSELLNVEHQGLFIRSTVSQVLQYLRGYNERQYSQHMRDLLLAPIPYRLHIRLLVVQQFAQLPNPTRAERHFARLHLLNSAEYREPFLESVRQRGWSQWLVEQQVVQQLLEQPQEWSSSERSVLWNMARYEATCMWEALGQIELNEVNGLTTQRAGWMLWLSSEDTSAGFESIFARFAAALVQHKAWEYVPILENRASREPEATAERLFEVLKDESHYEHRKEHNSMQEHRLKEAVETLLAAAPDTGFGLLRRLLEYWVERQSEIRLQEAGFEIEIRSIIGDTEFGLHTPNGRHASGLTAELYDLTQQQLEEAARQEPARARALLANWPTSNMRSLLQLTSATYLANPAAFTKDVYQLLMRPDLLRDVHHGGHLNYYLRELIAQSYVHLAITEREKLHGCILDTHSVLDWDVQREPAARTATTVCRRLYTRHGRLTHGYLSAIPNVEASSEAAVKRRYQELQRRFNTTVNRVPQGLTIRSGEPSPLRKEKLQLLGPEEWLAAFRKHQGRTGVFPFDDYGPGLARAFGEEVQARPEQLIAVIELLLATTNQDVPTRPLLEGLAGLAKSEAFNQAQYTDFVLRGVGNGQILLDNTEGLRLLESCVMDGQAEDRVVKLLAQIAVTHRRDARGTARNELEDGINTVGGHAIDGLLHCYKMMTHTGLMNETVRQIAADGSLAVRSATVYRSKLLMSLYHPATQPVLELLTALVGSDYQLMRFGEATLTNLLSVHLPELRALFTAALEEPASHEVVAQTLTLAWAWGIDTAYEQLQPYWQRSSKARTTSLRLLMHEYHKLSVAQKVKAQHVFEQLLAYDGDELRKTYEFCFLRLQVVEFAVWIPLVQAYASAPVGRGREKYFYDFLQLCVQDYPQECIELAAKFDSHATPNMQQNSLEKEPLELLLSAYHVLVEIDQDAPELELAMNTFDQMLRIPAYRQAATAALAQVDRC